MQIAILALQGAFQEHGAALDALDASHFEIRQRKDLDRPFDGLILPGGESTVMRKLLLDLELFHPLKARIQEGLPVFGTCAGLILLARDVEGVPLVLAPCPSLPAATLTADSWVASTPKENLAPAVPSP